MEPDASEEVVVTADDAKKKRYDRQLRLWGEHGQAAMENCAICLINGSPTGTETLKNLVLPGVRPQSLPQRAPSPAAERMSAPCLPQA